MVVVTVRPRRKSNTTSNAFGVERSDRCDADRQNDAAIDPRVDAVVRDIAEHVANGGRDKGERPLATNSAPNPPSAATTPYSTS